MIGRFDSPGLKLQRRVGIHWLLWWLTPDQWFKPYMNVFVTIPYTAAKHVQGFNPGYLARKNAP